ncbi:hypothetical protein JCM15124A_20370 [Prevotella falsenii]|uniref:hypothetical protein n=1 Tax=Prevotella falsenii TaxID=515414 RepID=UPI000469C30B|nr:hypothetical protein [Prevotella falsenii]
MGIKHVYDYNEMFVEKNLYSMENDNNEVLRALEELAEQNNCELVIHHFISERSRRGCLYEDFFIPVCPSRIRRKVHEILNKRYLTHIKVQDIFQDKAAIEQELYEGRKLLPSPNT